MIRIVELRKKIPQYLVVTLFSWLGRLITIICSLISIKFITSCLGVREYSIYSILINIVGWTALFDLGLGYSLQNFITESKTRNENTGIFISTTLIILTGFFVFVLLALYSLSPLLSNWLFGKISLPNSGNLSTLFFITTSIGVISIYGSITSKIYYGIHQGHIPNLLLALSSLLSLGVIFLVKNFGIMSITIIIIATTAIPAIINLIPIIRIIRNNDNFKKKFCLETAKILLKRGVSFGSFALMSALVLQVDYIVMSQNVQPKQIVEYNFLFKLYSVIFIAYSTLLSSLWPTFSNWKSLQKFNLIRKTIIRYIFFGIIAFIGFTIMVILYGQDIASILMNIKVEISLDLILFFGLYFCIRVWTDMFAMVLQSINLLKPFWFITPIQAIISIYFQVTLSQKFGANGIIMAIIISFLLTVTWALPLVLFKKLKFQN